MAANRPPDPQQLKAKEDLLAFFSDEENSKGVFYTRQLQVRFERKHFHWVTARALAELVDEGFLAVEARPLPATNSDVKVYWNKKAQRYNRRALGRLAEQVNAFCEDDFTIEIGRHGERMISEAFMLRQFLCVGREANSYNGKVWTESGHDLDFIFEKDGLAYGVEVKNQLQYINKGEFYTKIAMCEFLGIRPVFACRMLPTIWASDLIRNHQGYAMIFEHQLYPTFLKREAKRVQEELGLPVDSPNVLGSGIMDKFLRWHNQQRPVV